MCHPYGDGDHLGSLNDRVRRLEMLLSSLAQSHGHLGHIISNARIMDDANIPEDTAETEEPEGEPATSTSQRPLYQTSKLGMERDELLRAENQLNGIKTDAAPKPRASDPLGGGLSMGGTTWYGALALPSLSQRSFNAELEGEKIEVGSDIPQSAASVQIAMLISEGGARPSVLFDLINLLPPKNIVMHLMTLFFNQINAFRYGMYQPVFWLNFSELFEFIENPGFSGSGLQAARFVPFMATLFMVLAIAHASLEEDDMPEREAFAGSIRLFHAGRKCIEIGKCIRNEHIDLVLAEVIASGYCLMLRRTSDAWTFSGAAVRDAQAMGLHRDGSKLGLDARTTERRRRLWAIVYYTDRQTSIIMSRPSSIHDKHCDNAPPSDVDIEELSTEDHAVIPRSFEIQKKPGIFSFVYFRQLLARLIGDIVELFQDVTRVVRYNDVLAMDKRLAELLDRLPPYFRHPGDPAAARNLENECPFLPTQRCASILTDLLLVEFNFVRITLHRPCERLLTRHAPQRPQIH